MARDPADDRVAVLRDQAQEHAGLRVFRLGVAGRGGAEADRVDGEGALCGLRAESFFFFLKKKSVMREKT